ncbi:MAG: homogentisate 1,2-dioxygenase [Oligoflexales bacterium]
MGRQDLRYVSGFGNYHSSEALDGALPKDRNSPQKPPYGLFPEQLSGSAFTEKRSDNLHSWLYKIRPSVCHGPFTKRNSNGYMRTAPASDTTMTPSQLRWRAPQEPKEAKTFIDSWTTMAVNGDAAGRIGSAVHLYYANKPMDGIYFYNADGDLLIVPQTGALSLFTEFGIMYVEPSEIAVVPRGVRFKVDLPDGKARGYICENYGAHFVLPNLGPIGSNGLANPIHFLSPVAAYEEKKGDFTLVTKFGGQHWQAKIDQSPLNTIAWHGNYVPFKYDLKLFNTINTVSFDHPDPSIFTVLTSPTDKEGLANVDFVIFPPRWMVGEDTFRPPYYHRNVMSEFMGLIHGVYDAKPGAGFEPGGSSLHNCMSAHGPDAQAFSEATEAKLKPTYIDKTLAFMFESCFVYAPTKYALEADLLDTEYYKCWQNIPQTFHRS